MGKGRKGMLITSFGKTMTLKEWAAETGLNPRTIYSRIYNYKWSHEKAVSRELKWSRKDKQ